MKGKLPLRIASVAVAAGLLTSGAVAGWNYYRSGTQFRPDANNTALRENAVTFPGEEQDMVSQNQGTDDSASQHDPNAADRRTPERNTALNQSIELPSGLDASADQTLVTAENIPNNSAAAAPPSDSGYVITPDAGTAAPGGTTGSSSQIIGADTTGGAGSDTGDHNGNNTNNGTTAPMDTPATDEDEIPPIPDVRVDPDALPDDPYKQNGFNGKDFDTDNGISSGGSTGGNHGSSDGNTDENTSAYTYSFNVIQRNTISNLDRFYQGQTINAADFFQTCLFYITERNTETDESAIYRLVDYGENFRISSFSPTVSGDSFSVYFYYRINPQSAWHKYGPVTFNVARYELRLLMNYDYLNSMELSDEDTGTPATVGDTGDADAKYVYGEPLKLYPDESGDTTYDLSRYFYRMQPESYWSEFGWNNPLTQLFTGWAETPEQALAGETVGNSYTVSSSASGLIELYPTRLQDIPEGYSAYLTPLTAPLCGERINDGIFDSYFYQTVSGFPVNPSDDEWGFVQFCPALEIPKGTQILTLGEYQISIIESLSLPDSVLRIDDLDSNEISGEIYADPMNPYFSTDEERHVLYNKDQTELLTVTAEVSDLTIPEKVGSIHLPSMNSLSTIRFLSTVPPEMFKTDAGDISGTDSIRQIYVPLESEVRYFAQLHSLLTENTDDETRACLYTVDPTGQAVRSDLIESNGLILSADGKTLRGILPSVNGTCVLPDTIETIAANALELADSVTTLVVPAGVTSIQTDSLNGPALRRVMFSGTTPPTLEPDALPDDGTVALCVLPDNIQSYKQSWGEDVTLTPTQFGIYDEDGWRYLHETGSDGCRSLTLLHVPSDLTRFDENTLGTDTHVTAIGDYAFANADQLKTVILPDTVSQIGKYAFLGCTALEGIYSARTDDMYLDETAFLVQENSTAKGSLRFICLHSMNVTFNCSDPEVYNGWPFYAPDGAHGYPDIVRNDYSWSVAKTLGPGYTLEANPDGGMLLYSEAREHYADGLGINFGGTYGSFLVAATTDLAGEVTLPAETIQIVSNAFLNCTNEFSFTNRLGYYADGTTDEDGELLYYYDAPLYIIGDYAFKNSGITSLTLPELEYMGSEACSGCQKLQTVDISEAVRLWNLGSFAFADCSSLTEFLWSEQNVNDVSQQPSIDVGTFSSSGLTEMTIPTYVSVISDNAFNGCSALSSLSFADSEEAPATVNTIGDNAFSDCTSLTSIDLPDSLSYLGLQAFLRSGLTELTIPSGVDNVGADIVTGCPLTFITFTGAVPPIMFTGWGTSYTSFKTIPDPDDDFAVIPDPDFRVVLTGEAEGHEEDYIKAWYEAMSPVDSDTNEYDYLTGVNTARRLFDLEPLTELPDYVSQPSSDLPAAFSCGSPSDAVGINTADTPTQEDDRSADAEKNDRTNADAQAAERIDTPAPSEPASDGADGVQKDTLPENKTNTNDADDAASAADPDAGAEEGGTTA